MLRRLLTPRWLLGLLLALAAAAVMVRLGWWQLGRGERFHSLQNYSYAVEWVLFAGFTLFGFVRLLRDAGRPRDEDEGEPDRPDVVLAPPRPAPAEDGGQPEDQEVAAYNAYLAELAERHARSRR